MNRVLVIICAMVHVFALSGCAQKSGLRYEECLFSREEYYENWVVESYEGITAESIAASAESLTVKLCNGLEHDIEFQSWSGAFVYREDVWYSVLPPTDRATAEPEIEKTFEEQSADTVSAGESKEYTVNFPDMYQGESLPSGNYRISITFKFLSPTDPERIEHEKVWIDFVVD